MSVFAFYIGGASYCSQDAGFGMWVSPFGVSEMIHDGKQWVETTPGFGNQNRCCLDMLYCTVLDSTIFVPRKSNAISRHKS